MKGSEVVAVTLSSLVIFAHLVCVFVANKFLLERLDKLRLNQSSSKRSTMQTPMIIRPSKTHRSRDVNTDDAQPCSEGPTSEFDWTVFTEHRAWYFILIVMYCLSEIVTLVVFRIAVSKETAAIGSNKTSRATQDIMDLPRLCFFYMIFMLLLNVLFYMAQIGHKLDAATYIRRGIMQVLVLISLLVITAVLTGTVDPLALEYLSVTLEFSFAVAYIFSSRILYNRIYSYSEEVHHEASRVRNVCMVVSLCLVIRATVLFPILQNEMAGSGAAVFPILELVGLLPICGSMFLLHHR